MIRYRIVASEDQAPSRMKLIQKAARAIKAEMQKQYGVEYARWKSTSAWSQYPYVQLYFEFRDYTKEDLEDIVVDQLDKLGLDISYGIDDTSSNSGYFVDLFDADRDPRVLKRQSF